MAFTVDQAYDLLKKSHEENRLAHAYLIYGSHRADMQELALRLVNLVNGWDCSTFEELTLRGVHILEPESKLRRIKVDQVRDLERRFHFSSDNNWKVGIFVDADRQVPEAANAFLKTLEEPPPQTLILELTTQPEQMLDTVRSRCIRVPLFRAGRQAMELTPPQEQLLEGLARHFSGPLNTTRSLSLLKAFQDILTGIRDRHTRENDAAYKEEVENYGQTTDGSWLKDREDHYGNLTEAAYNADRAALAALLYLWLGEILRKKAGAQGAELPQYAGVIEMAAKKIDLHDLHRRMDAVDELRKHLGTNVREILALEVCFMKAFG